LRLFAFAHTACGILALYFTVSYWLRRYREPDSQPGPFLRQCSRLCYGVYVFHMFFMKPFYYNTPFPAWCAACRVGEWLIPWVVLSVTLGLSILVTWLLLKTSFGRFLIG
jgi:surface polysaccharide O-acyltransferase-like enzyme